MIENSEGNMRNNQSTPPPSQKAADVGDHLENCYFQLSSSLRFLKYLNDNDELTTYFSATVGPTERDMLLTDEEFSTFGSKRETVFLELSKIAFRILAMPPSSASGERDFSLLKLPVGK